MATIVTKNEGGFLPSVLIAHYEATRAEVLERMKMRQTILTVYLGFVGTVLGLAVGTNPRIDALIVIPLASFGVAWIIRDHELGLACLGSWLEETYQQYIDENPVLQGTPQWDGSKLRQKYGRLFASRFVGYVSLFLIADLAGLFISWGELSTQVYLRWIGIALTTFTLIILSVTFAQRRKI